MTVTDDCLRNNAGYAGSLRQSMARIAESPFVPHKDRIRGFVYEVETGLLREVS